MASVRGLGEGEVGSSLNVPRTLWTPLAEEPVGRSKSCSQRVAVWWMSARKEGYVEQNPMHLGWKYKHINVPHIEDIGMKLQIFVWLYIE